jgi:hypothetical protein
VSLLDHPNARTLLADAALTPGQVRGCQDRINALLECYLPRLYHPEPMGAL